MSHLDFMIRKLRHTTELDDADIVDVLRLAVTVKDVPADTPIIREGDKPFNCCLLIKGYCVRSKTTEQGKRQILSVHIPGDMPDLQSLHLPVMDHELRTLSTSTIGYVSHTSIRALARSRPLVAEALWRQTLLDAVLFRDWIVNIGRRSAEQRLVHLFIELYQRLAVVGLVHNETYDLPMTQTDLADATGLTPVHVSRVLKSLREHGLIQMRRSVVTIGNASQLSEWARVSRV
jgi:CRP-like cAMP-binding protein